MQKFVNANDYGLFIKQFFRLTHWLEMKGFMRYI